MKKVVSFMKVLALLIVPVLLIASCNGKEDPTTSIPTDHVHSYTEEVIAPTCTEDGYTLHKCSCGDSYKDTTVAKLGHSFGAWKVTVEPTNTQTGSKERECQTCHVKETQVVPVRQTEHTHTYDNWQVAKNPTDKAEGLLVRNCIAEDKSETFVLPALNTTDYTKGDESVDSTCSVAGVYEYVYTKDEQAFSFKVALQRLEHELETKTKEATCTESGYVRTTCKNCDYKVEETTKPLGHTWNHDEASCDYAKTCTVCHTVGEAQKTHHALAVTTPATCEQAGKIVYTCEYCNKKLSEEAIPALGHDYSNWNQIGAEQKNSKCEVIQHYSRTCTLCNHEESYDDVLRVEHNYTSEVTTEALCNKAGTITYTCLDCGASYEKSYENTSAHSFVSKGIKNNIETFKCSHCDATKTVLSYKDKTEANVNKENLNNEIELKNASIALDENTVNALPQNITIKADTVNKDDLRLNDSYADAIGNNTIYNFGMNSGEDAISSFDGKVTVRVPYELKAGENPDEIAIWYINDEGTPTAIKAKYANGFAEFETNHFSYYTVIRLSGEDRCKVYEHDYMIKHIDGDCFHDSYDLNTCRYCGRVEKANVIHHTGHVYIVVENVAATCVQAGYTTYKCANCDSEYKTYILPVGHSYELQDGSIKATCTNAGLEKYECSVCHDKYETALAQQSHQFNDVVTKDTCTLQGYTTHTCKNCSLVIVDTYTNPTGHNYISTIVEPTCTEPGYTLNKCANCGDEYKTNETAPKHKWNIPAPTCGEDQVCTVCGTIGASATGEHTFNDKGICIDCGYGCTHTFKDAVIEPTCTTDGYTTHTCTNCGLVKKDTTVTKLGHEGNIVCTRCGELTVPEEFISNLLPSYKDYTSVTLSAPYARVTVKDITDGDLEADVIITNVVITLGLNAERKFIGYGKGELQYTDYNNSIGYTNVILIIKNNTIYIKATESLTVDPDTISTIWSSTYETYDSVDHYYAVSFEQFMTEAHLPNTDQIEDILKEYKPLIEDVITVLNKIYTANKPLLKKLAINVLDKLFILNNNGTSYTLTLNINYFIDIYNYAKTHKAAEIIDYILGTGTVEAIRSFIANADKLTIGEAIDTIINYTGLTVDEIVELVNKYVKLDGDKTIEQIINEFLGNTSGSLVDYLKSDLFRKANLFETINKLLKNNMKIEIDFVSYIKMALEAIDEYKDYTIKDFIEMAGLNINLDEIFKVIDGYIERYKDILDITISTDYVGNITSLKVTTKGTVNDDDYWTADGDISIDFTFNDNVVIEDDFTGLVDNIISLDIPALFKENYKNLVKDDDGNIIGFFSEDKDSDTGNRTEGQFTYETIYTRHTKNYIYFNKNTYIDSFTIDCGNWSKIQYSGCFKKEEKYYTTVYNTYYKGNLIDTHTETSNPSYLESSSSSFTFFFNVKTQKFIFNNSYRDTMHDFRLTNHVDSNGCGTYATDVYVCADCGYTKTKYSFEGHKFTGEETYELINPNGTYKDGVKVYQLCDQCQKNVLKYTNHYHSSWHEEYKLKDGATSCEDGIIVSRVCNLCGAVDSTYETNNHRTTEKEISLADYGFKGNLTISECACGQIKNAYFSGDYDNSKKEYLDEKVTIDGIDYNAEVTTYYYGENAFVIRRLTATVENENCQAVSITLYQYGYKDDGSSLYEIKEQNETYSHKPQMLEETKENGDGTSTITQTWKCTECSTITYVTIYEYDSNRKLVTHIIQDYSGSGMLSSIYTEKYTYINGKQFIIFVRTEELNSWSQKEIKPDIDRCMQIVTYTSSNGQNETTEETHHFDVTIHPASCTQPGYSVCNKCGETLYDQYPHRHKFDYVAGHWKCSYCGLESDNTNNGVIALEELESESQNTLSYGYCFDRYSGVDAIFNISVIINGTHYAISYEPDTTTHIYSDHLIYGQINIDLATLNSKINTLIEENNLEVESIILSVNALDANSQYSTSITLSYSLNI